MTDKLNAATIRELLGRITPEPWQARFIHRLLQSARRDPELIFGFTPDHDWADSQFFAAAPAIARYALELSDKLKECKGNPLSGNPTEWGHQSLIVHLRKQRDTAKAQLQSQAAELERLRAQVEEGRRFLAPLLREDGS
jgi:hypothetical protein